MLRQIALALTLLALTGCSIIYKQPISQGNIITAFEANQIKNGMSVKQVVHTIGFPVMTNIYPENRLVYVYSLKPGHDDLQTKRFIVHFRNRRVSSIQSS